jgi:predicted nucleic-acid-binding protein
MNGLDTNVLVRYLTRDDPAQYRAAKSFLESACTQEEPGYINAIVLCELVWVRSNNSFCSSVEQRRGFQLLRAMGGNAWHADRCSATHQLKRVARSST